MIMKPMKMEIAVDCPRRVLMDRFFVKNKLLKGTPGMIYRMTPDVSLWIKKGWVKPYEEKKELIKKVKKK